MMNEFNFYNISKYLKLYIKKNQSIIMKKISLLILFMTLGVLSFAQNSSLNIQFGTGTPYLYESNDPTVDIKYSSTLTFQSGWIYHPKDFYFDLHFNFQYLNSKINGLNWKTLNFIDGEISSFTTSLLLEKMTNNEKWNFGYSFGMGVTFENLIEDLNSRNKEERSFMTFTIEPIMAYDLSEKVTLRLSPKLLWFDPIKSFESPNHYYIGGEDITMLLQIGLNLKL